MKYQNIREEELKNKIADDYFWNYDCSKIIGNIDFCVCMIQSQSLENEQEYLLWAEAKIGLSDIYKSLTQLVLTIGKARTFDKFMPPAMLGSFDSEKIAFIPYNEIQRIFYINDFNWNVAPSNYETKEFKLIYDTIKQIIDQKSLIFNYETDHKELIKFIKNNFVIGKFGLNKTKIDKNNFVIIYNKWLQTVKPSIAIDWDKAKKNNISDIDFYYADLLSYDDISIKDKLSVFLKKDHYELERNIDEMGLFNSSKTSFKDEQKGHHQFWNRYERPPINENWEYIVLRRDLLVPQDVREKKGSFFTPLIWVELSQKYLTDFLGINWQDEYYIWDCAAGTGNLLIGLTNKYNIWASTLDKQDVDVLKDRIVNGANLLENHVFQFNFLNDDFSKLPDSLQNIIYDPIKRKKLIIYINPPYAESGSSIKKNSKKGVNQNLIHDKYNVFLKRANHELYAQFLARIYNEIPDCIIAEFSKIKALQGSHFKDFRSNFLAKLEKIFLCPADTFDNVKGKFPIGFKIWNTSQKIKFNHIIADVYNDKGIKIGHKNVFSYDNEKGLINHWIKSFNHTNKLIKIGEIGIARNDMQHQALCWIGNTAERGLAITSKTLIYDCIFFTVQNCIKANWLNDRDQFLYPNNGWKKDNEFQNDCLTYSLFKNQIKSKSGTNHWIPFNEYEVAAKDRFESDFMINFITGKLGQSIVSEELFAAEESQSYNTPLVFSEEARTVFKAGRELWEYYHNQPKSNVNASLYDIKEHFQGRNEKGVMKTKSQDEVYNHLITTLRTQLNHLANKIALKVYQYEFLKK